MDVIIEEDYESMSARAADDFFAFVETLDSPLICPASGDTPAGLYEKIAGRSSGRPGVQSAWSFVALDEWMGMNGTDEGSCRNYLDRQLFHPLEIQEDRICFFDGRAASPEEECRKVEEFIQHHGGIDLCILGLGLNGHIGMNEPGASPRLRSHIAILSSETAMVGQKYFSSEQKLEKGLTIGIATIMQARKIFLLVSGEKKAEAVRRLMDIAPSTEFPASLLKSHPDFSIYLDAPAARLLKNP